MPNNYKTIFVHGIYTVNVGDDLFLRMLASRYPTTKMVMYAPERYKQFLGCYSNCIVYSDSDASIRRLLVISKIFHLPASLLIYIFLFVKHRILLFLIIGGSLFIEGNSHVPSLLNGLKKLRILFPKLKIAIMGSNFGPCITTDWKRQVLQSLSVCDDVCFRDKPSFDEFSSLATVRWGNDIVMHLTPQIAFTKKKRVSINIRSVDNWNTLKPYKTQYLANTKKIIECFIQGGYSIYLLSFCEKYGDSIITEDLYNSIENKGVVKKCFYRGNIEEIMEIIATSEYIIGTRFHAIVLGLTFGLKVLPISYSIKTENMLKTLGIWRDVYEYASYCSTDVSELLDSFVDGFVIDSENNKQFDYLDKILCS